MEVDIVFPHKLVQSDILRVEPPSSPFRSVVGSDTRVSDRSIKLAYGQEMLI